jgi:hypothetical protein
VIQQWRQRAAQLRHLLAPHIIVIIIIITTNRARHSAVVCRTRSLATLYVRPSHV